MATAVHPSNSLPFLDTAAAQAAVAVPIPIKGATNAKVMAGIPVTGASPDSIARGLQPHGHVSPSTGAVNVTPATASPFGTPERKPSLLAKMFAKGKTSPPPSPASAVLRSTPVAAVGRSDNGGRVYAYSGEVLSLVKKYGVCEKQCIGRGANAVVKTVVQRSDKCRNKIFAVKEFRKRRKNETEKEYVKKLTSEFCISSSLHHVNIVETIDLLQDEQNHWVEVMEYCPGGDLYTAIKKAGSLPKLESDNYFKQLINGVTYLHDMGVAHRDIKPENLLLAEDGTLKITDFGTGECFRLPWEKETKECRKTRGLCGSGPYISPEEYTCKEFDPRAVDIWSVGVVYMVMLMGRIMWRVAANDDEYYLRYLEDRSADQFEPFKQLPSDAREVIEAILDPAPENRPSMHKILESPWVKQIKIFSPL